MTDDPLHWPLYLFVLVVGFAWENWPTLAVGAVGVLGVML